jgi:hypothetical protein
MPDISYQCKASSFGGNHRPRRPNFGPTNAAVRPVGGLNVTSTTPGLSTELPLRVVIAELAEKLIVPAWMPHDWWNAGVGSKY